MDIKEMIQSKYGTIKRFLELADLPYMKVHAAINGKQDEAVEILNIIERTNPPKRIKWTDELSRKIKKEIQNQYVTQERFSEVTGINKARISFACNNGFGYVNSSNKEILDALNIDYES